VYVFRRTHFFRFWELGMRGGVCAAKFYAAPLYSFTSFSTAVPFAV
jgi:hypothetical protein